MAWVAEKGTLEYNPVLAYTMPIVSYTGILGLPNIYSAYISFPIVKLQKDPQ